MNEEQAQTIRSKQELANQRRRNKDKIAEYERKQREWLEKRLQGSCKEARVECPVCELTPSLKATLSHLFIAVLAYRDYELFMSRVTPTSRSRANLHDTAPYRAALYAGHTAFDTFFKAMSNARRFQDEAHTANPGRYVTLHWLNEHPDFRGDYMDAYMFRNTPLNHDGITQMLDNHVPDSQDVKQHEMVMREVIDNTEWFTEMRREKVDALGKMIVSAHNYVRALVYSSPDLVGRKHQVEVRG